MKLSQGLTKPQTPPPQQREKINNTFPPSNVNSAKSPGDSNARDQVPSLNRDSSADGNYNGLPLYKPKDTDSQSKEDLVNKHDTTFDNKNNNKGDNGYRFNQQEKTEMTNDQQHLQQRPSSPPPKPSSPPPKPSPQQSAQDRLNSEWISFRNQKLKEETDQLRRQFMKQYERSTVQPQPEQDVATSEESPENEQTVSMKEWKDYLKESEDTDENKPTLKPLKVIGKLKDIMRRRLGQRPINGHAKTNSNKERLNKDINRKWYKNIQNKMKQKSAGDKRELNNNNGVIDKGIFKKRFFLGHNNFDTNQKKNVSFLHSKLIKVSFFYLKYNFSMPNDLFFL